MASSILNKTKIKSRSSIDKDTAEIMKMMGPLVSLKPTTELMQNCDLPRPAKVFSLPENTNRLITCEPQGVESEDEKLELVKALRSSQIRAGEAERKAEALAKENEWLYKGLMEDSVRLLAYRQWVRLLEVQVSMLRSQWRTWSQTCPSCPSDKSKAGDGGGTPWLVALALCFGIAGVGFAFTCRYCF